MNPKSLANLVATNRAPRPRINAVTQHRVLHALLDGATIQEIQEDSGLGYQCLIHYLSALHKPADGVNLIYVRDWFQDKRGSYSVRVFKWGPGMRDKTKPRMTNTEKNQRWRAKKSRASVQTALSAPL